MAFYSNITPPVLISIFVACYKVPNGMIFVLSKLDWSLTFFLQKTAYPTIEKQTFN